MCSFGIHTFSVSAHLISSFKRLPTAQRHGCHDDGKGAVNNDKKSMSKTAENNINL